MVSLLDIVLFPPHADILVTLANAIRLLIQKCLRLNSFLLTFRLLELSVLLLSSSCPENTTPSRNVVGEPISVTAV